MTAGNVIPMQKVPECHICHDTTDYHLSICRQCKKHFCFNDASKIMPFMCSECMHDVAVTEEVVVKTEEHYDEETDTVTVRKSKPALKINIHGVDWVFYQRSIEQLNDDELKLQLRTLRGAVSLLETELTERQIKKIAGIRLTSGGKSVSTATTTTVRKTTRPNKPVNLESLKAAAKAAGLTPEMLKKMFGGS